MDKIHSAIDARLLHFNFMPWEYLTEDVLRREELIGAENFLQLSVLSLKLGDAFPAHAHLDREFSTSNLKAQESWVILSGSVQVNYYDIDDTLIKSKVLDSGSVSVTLHGGHSYKSLSKETLVLEFKSGPYEGRDFDKRLIAKP